MADNPEGQRFKHYKALYGVVGTVLAATVPLIIGKYFGSNDNNNGSANVIQNVVQVYVDGLKVITGSDPGKTPPTSANSQPSGQPDQEASQNLKSCSGFEPSLKLERVSASPVKDGYVVTFSVRNPSELPTTLSTTGPNHLHDDQKNDLSLRETNLPAIGCNPAPACAKDSFANGVRIEPGALGAISYRFLGINEGKFGGRVTINANAILTKRTSDGTFDTAITTISCDNLMLGK
jgi:hypothetical protein